MVPPRASWPPPANARHKQSWAALQPLSANAARHAHRSPRPARPKPRQNRRWPATARNTRRHLCRHERQPAVPDSPRPAPRPAHTATRVAPPAPASLQPAINEPVPGAIKAFRPSRYGQPGFRSDFRVASHHPATRHPVRHSRWRLPLQAKWPAHHRARYRLLPAPRPKPRVAVLAKQQHS